MLPLTVKVGRPAAYREQAGSARHTLLQALLQLRNQRRYTELQSRWILGEAAVRAGCDPLSPEDFVDKELVREMRRFFLSLNFVGPLPRPPKTLVQVALERLNRPGAIRPQR